MFTNNSSKIKLSFAKFDRSDKNIKSHKKKRKSKNKPYTDLQTENVQINLFEQIENKDEKVYICIVRYPSINRIDQMFLDNPSAVDYNLFFNYIYGLCFSSPYSWKDNNWKNEKGETDYTDSLGVFDLNRKKIVECLIKNHDYKEESEVGEYRRSIVK